ncbi:hypothetical protein ACIQK6_38650 [Streptomyces sp. NPDC091682]|uniref:hypothetical protein n=1 Tax=Streptomyces sp. NPDC091682 TaxID=3366005 RepID=UPI0038133CAE
MARLTAHVRPCPLGLPVALSPGVFHALGLRELLSARVIEVGAQLQVTALGGAAALEFQGVGAGVAR